MTSRAANPANGKIRDRRYWASPKGRYCRHKANAKRRGVEFKLSFVDWLIIWMESGKWPQRGNRRGKYCMARNGDVGAYENGNVTIALHEANTGARNKSVAARGTRVEPGKIDHEDTWP